MEGSGGNLAVGKMEVGLTLFLGLWNSLLGSREDMGWTTGD